MATHIVHVNAGNDTNGNPRRAYIVLDGIGGPKMTYNEGYEGWQAVPKADREANAEGGTWTELYITPGQYRTLLKG